MRLPARLGWQANRLSPTEVWQAVGPSLTDAAVYRSPKRRPFGQPPGTVPLPKPACTVLVSVSPPKMPSREKPAS